MGRKRGRTTMDGEELKKYSLLNDSLKRKLPLRSLMLKKIKLVRKSHIDIMVRRKKSEAIKGLRKFKEEEMKKIESEVASMKRDLLAFMLKELEDQKKIARAKMVDAIEEEKRKRLKVIELELSRSLVEKGVQTNTDSESVDLKFDAIFEQLREVKNSSMICKNILMKSNYAALFANAAPADVSSPSLEDSVSTNDSVGSLAAVVPPGSLSSTSLAISTEGPEDHIIISSKNRRVTQYSNSTKSLLPKITHKQQYLSKTVDKQDVYPSCSTSLFTKSSREMTTSNKNVSLGPRSLRFPFGESISKLPTKRSANQSDGIHDESLFSSEPYLTSEKLHPRERRTFGDAVTSDITMVDRDASPYEDMVVLDEHNLSSGNVSMVSRTPPYQEEEPLMYEQATGLNIHDDEKAVDLTDSITIKEEEEEEQEDNTSEQPTTNDNGLPTQNVSQQDTAAYIRNLLSTNQNLLPSKFNSSSSDENISEENTAAYIKKLLISSQLSQPEVTSSSYNAYIDEVAYDGIPAETTSENTAVYIKNLLMSSPTSSTTITSPIPNHANKTTCKNAVQPSFLVHSMATSYSRQPEVRQTFNRPPEVKQTFGGKRRSYARRPDNSAYNIYTYNKRLISSQEKRGTYSERGDDDLKSYSVRKKRELNKRIYEKYGPLKNHKEIADMIQTDQIFLSLSAVEQSGLLSCLTRSVAEHLTLSKDLLEELFSREVLSISSCKGSPIKTALNSDKLSLIKRIVFLALPSHDEKALWEMIQDSIDTKCRGILRNMKKKLTKRNMIN